MFFYFIQWSISVQSKLTCIDTIFADKIVNHYSLPLYKKQQMCYHSLYQNSYYSFSSCPNCTLVIDYYLNPFTSKPVTSKIIRMENSINTRLVISFGPYYATIGINVTTETLVQFDIFNPPISCQNTTILFQNQTNLLVTSDPETSFKGKPIEQGKGFCILFSSAVQMLPIQIAFPEDIFSSVPIECRNLPDKNPRYYVENISDPVDNPQAFGFFYFGFPNNHEICKQYTQFLFNFSLTKEDEPYTDFQFIEETTDLPYKLSAITKSIITIVVLSLFMIGMGLASCLFHKDVLIDTHL